MAKYRRDRVQETMRTELSEIIKRDLKDPRLGFVTITDVELSNDMSHAKVFVSIYGSEEEKRLSMQALESAKGFIRTNLGQRVRLRIVPELVFKEDNSIAPTYIVHVPGLTTVTDFSSIDEIQEQFGGQNL